MDPMVSARVPEELRNQVNGKLRSNGSSPTELINAAYTYYLDYGQLPNEQHTQLPGKRTYSKQQFEELRSSFQRSTYAVPASYFANESDDEILARVLKEQYEALS